MNALGPEDAAAMRRERLPVVPPRRPRPMPMAALLVLRAWRALRRR